MSAGAQPYVPQAPAPLHIDVAETLMTIGEPRARAAMPHPETAMELQLLEAARDCAEGKGQLPRRELVAVALREAERQQWWRDQAEAEKEALRRELAVLTRAHDEYVQEMRQQRKHLMGLLFELITWASGQLKCRPSAEAVLAAIRGQVAPDRIHAAEAVLADRIHAEVRRG